MSGDLGRVVVTGASGRVGSAVIEALVAQGEDVVGLDVRSRAEPVAGARHEVVDLVDGEGVVGLLDGARVVVHLAALMSWDPRDAQAVFDANVTATVVLFDACRTAGVERAVFASSGEVYPESAPVSLPIDESHPRRPTTPYGLSKLLGEEIAAFHDRTGLPCTVLRLEHTQRAAELLDPSSFFSGPRFYLRARITRERSLGHTALADLLARHDRGGERLLLLRDGEGRTTRMPITDHRDTVQGIVLAAAAGDASGRTVGIGPAAAVDFNTALPLLAEVTGLDVAEVEVPGPLPRYDVSIDAARKLLGYEPSWTFEAMVEDAADR